MFLDSICKLGLLDHNPETNVLLRFPYEVRRGIVNYVASYLADPATNATATLPSQMHVRFALECIGEGFRLTLDNSQIISSCIDIYSRWLADENARPAPMNDNLEYYVLAILEQLSLLFQNRSKTNSEMQSHAELCKRALSLFSLVVSKIPLTRAAWDRIQKLLIGVSAFRPVDGGFVGRIPDEFPADNDPGLPGAAALVRGALAVTAGLWFRQQYHQLSVK